MTDHSHQWVNTHKISGGRLSETCGCGAYCVIEFPPDGPPSMSCCYGWRIRSYATNGRTAPTRNAAPPVVKAGWSRHPKAVVVVLERLTKTIAGDNPMVNQRKNDHPLVLRNRSPIQNPIH